MLKKQVWGSVRGSIHKQMCLSIPGLFSSCCLEIIWWKLGGWLCLPLISQRSGRSISAVTLAGLLVSRNLNMPSVRGLLSIIYVIEVLDVLHVSRAACMQTRGTCRQSFYAHDVAGLLSLDFVKPAVYIEVKTTAFVHTGFFLPKLYKCFNAR